MIVVTAPTGKIGSRVLRGLLERDAAVRVIARNADKIPLHVRSRIEIVPGSHNDAGVLDQALEGASALLWLAPGERSKTPEEAYIDFTRPAAEAIRRHHVARVVSITALGRGTMWEGNAGLVTASIHMDNLLMATGAAFRGLAMPSFMDNALHNLASIRDQSTMFGAYLPDRKTPKIAIRDIAAAAAKLLADETLTDQHDVPLVGPEDLSMNDMAAIVSDVLGQDIRYKQIPYSLFKQRMIGQGVSEAFAQGSIDMFKAKDEGMDNVASRDCGLRSPTTFRQWCEDELVPALGV